MNFQHQYLGLGEDRGRLGLIVIAKYRIGINRLRHFFFLGRWLKWVVKRLAPQTSKLAVLGWVLDI